MKGDAWLAAYIGDDAGVDPGDHLFRWDGKFVSNDHITGTWKLLGETTDPDDMDPGNGLPSVRRPDFQTITFKDDGDTSLTTRMWSGDTLMNLDQYVAQRMFVKSIGGKDYLLIQSPGNFHRPNKNQEPEITWWVFGR